MADRRGLGAALSGGLQGALASQLRKQERGQELEDREAAQQQALARIQLVDSLRRAAQEQSIQSQGQQDLKRDQQRRLNELQTALSQGLGRATGLGFGFSGIDLGSKDPTQLRRWLADVLSVITAKEGATKEQEKARDVTHKLSEGQILLDEEGNVIAANPRPARPDKPSVPRLGEFAQRVQELQETTNFRDGLSLEDAARQAAMELFGIDTSGIKFRGLAGLYDRLVDMFEAAVAFPGNG